MHNSYNRYILKDFPVNNYIHRINIVLNFCASFIFLRFELFKFVSVYIFVRCEYRRSSGEKKKLNKETHISDRIHHGNFSVAGKIPVNTSNIW